MKKPNIIIPLASSYNPRGVQGYSTTTTGGKDQRKLNCFYELAKNQVTGRTSLNLTKRPGVSIHASSFGTGTNQQDFSILTGFSPSDISTPPIVFWVDLSGSDAVKVSDAAGSTTIFSSSGYLPIYVDRTLISGVDTVVCQSCKSSNAGPHKIFFATTRATWTEITDGDFPGSTAIGKMEHMDGYAFIMTTDNKVFNSDTNSLANWTSTSFLRKQVRQDVAKGLMKFGKQILAFGEKSVEVYYNAGNPSGSPLSIIPQLSAEVGNAYQFAQNGRYSALVGNKLYFYGRGAGGQASASIYSFDGSNFIKISPDYIDKILLSSQSTGPSHIYRMGFMGKQALALALIAVPNSTVTWLMYFPEWNEWFEWNSTVFSPINDGEWFLPADGKERVYQFLNSSGVWADNGTNYLFATQFKLPASGPERKRMMEFGVIADTDTAANTLTVEVSDDDYANFTTKATLDLTAVRKSTVRGGTYIDRAIRLSNTNARETRLQSFVALVK